VADHAIVENVYVEKLDSIWLSAGFVLDYPWLSLRLFVNQQIKPQFCTKHTIHQPIDH
jgi:hypothetical protein